MSAGKAIKRTVSLLLVCGMVPGLDLAAGGATAFASSSPPAQSDHQQSNVQKSSVQQGDVQADTQRVGATLRLVRAFSSADDVRRPHSIADQTLDIIAGPADPETRVEALQSPVAVTTDSQHRIFVADPGAKGVHIFDFIRSKYSLLDSGRERLSTPIALAVDAQDNLYVVDQKSRFVLIYDSTGKFRRYLGKLRGGEESYFDSPAGVAIDKTTGRIYVCDRQRHTIFIMDERGRLISKVGNRSGGNGPGEFRFPSQVVVSGSELFVLDAGNLRIQILDTEGHFLCAIQLAYADKRTGLAVDDEGSIYVSDASLNQIQVFSSNGQRLYTSNPSSIKGASFSRPSGMFIDAGRLLYVVDSQSNRVGLFQISGKNMRQ